MALWKRFHKQRPGEVVAARTLRTLAEQADWTAQVRATPPLAGMATANGPLFRLPGMLFEIYVAVTTTTISARSGGTPGSGSAKPQSWNGTALADLPGSPTFTVYNISASTTTIASGKYCIIVKVAGAWFIVTAEC